MPTNPTIMFQLAGSEDTDFRIDRKELLRSKQDWMIIESGETFDLDDDAAGLIRTLRPAQIDKITDRGQELIGYVNVSVPDYNRDYWERDGKQWVIPSSANLDFGPLTENAPTWLQENWGTASTVNPDGTTETFGYIVEYANTDWQDLVFEQSVQILEAGYTGIFIDDVNRYSDAHLANEDYESWEAARDMMQAVVNIVTRVEDETGMSREDMTVVVNGGMYIVNDYYFGLADQSRRDEINFDLINDYRAIIDGLVAENQGAVPTSTGVLTPWETANRWFNGTIDFIPELSATTTALTALEDATLIDNIEALFDTLSASEVSLLVARNQDYGSALNLQLFGDDGENSIRGSNRDEVIIGFEGMDELLGRYGDDIIFGGSGDDIIRGSKGDDIIFAGSGNDTIYGGGGNDTIIGGDGNDLIISGTGNDVVVGGGGNDDIRTNAGGTNTVYQDQVPDDVFIF